MTLRSCIADVLNMHDEDVSNIFANLGENPSKADQRKAIQSAIDSLMQERAEFVDAIQAQHGMKYRAFKMDDAEDATNDEPSQGIKQSKAAQPPSGASGGVLPGQPQPMSLPDESRTEKFQRTIQDKWNRWTTLHAETLKNGGKVTTQNNVYKAEERSHGRIASRIEDFEQKVLKPILDAMSAGKVTHENVNEYLKVAHAKERNTQIRTVDPSNDSGSGITDKDADNRMAALQAMPNFRAIKQAADAVQAVTKQRLDMMQKAGIVSAEQRAAYDGAYKYYVPLKTNDDSSGGTGKGQSVSGKQKRATGRTTEADDVFANIVRDYYAGVVAVEKNTVGQHLAQFIADNRDLVGNLITLDQPDTTKIVVNGKTQTRPLPALQDNEAYIYIKGKPVRVTFRDDLLARAYTNMGQEQLDTALGYAKALNGYLSKVYTGYNPEFIFKNMVRDALSGMVNLTATEGAKVAATAAKNYAGIFGSLVRYSFSGKASGEFSKLIEEYRANGGNTGASWLPDLDRINAELQNTMDDQQGAMSLLSEASSKADKSKAWRGVRTAGRKAAGALAGWIEHLNVASENAFRMATYKAVRDAHMNNGMSTADAQAEAASAAKNVTVNFNRKGESKFFPAAYLFFNPAVQDTANLLKNLSTGKHKTEAWALLGGMATIAMLARLAWDDDDWDEIPQNTRDRNIVLPTGKTNEDGSKGYVLVPIPYGYGWIMQMGQRTGNVMRGADVGKEAMHAGVSALDTFSPIKVTNGFTNALPTALSIVGNPLTNTNSFGSDLKPDFREAQPDNEKMFKGTKGGIYDRVSQFGANHIGNKYIDELTDVSPEVLKYWTSTLGGGAAKFWFDAGNIAIQVGTGNANAIDLKDTPILRGVAGNTDYKALRSRFYEVAKEAEAHSEAYKQAVKKGDAEYVTSMDDHEKELIQLGQMAAGATKSGNAYYNAILAIQSRSDLTPAEKDAQQRPLEQAMKQLYRNYLDISKGQK
jgi:hypothetical protein